jgi:hypothetical protein
MELKTLFQIDFEQIEGDGGSYLYLYPFGDLT